MSPRLPRVTAAQLLRALERDGWRIARQRGSHIRLEHPTRPGKLTVPRHTGKTMPPQVIESVLDGAGLTGEDLRRLLRG